MINIVDDNGVKITLTPEQLTQIDNQRKKNNYTSIKRLEDACEKLGIKLTDITPAFKYLNKSHIAYIKLGIIIEALNNEWIPNWNASSESKYFNYFRMQGGFSSYSTAYHTTCTLVPSALYFKTKEIAEYAAKQFIDLYKEYYEIPQ